MEELLSLKWNNHRNSFINLLSVLRKQTTYTDVTLACEGKVYKAHKMVLSACSDYFRTIFDSISCPNPVIILKDMSASNLEALLDYMYLGEVSVKQSDLSSLIQAAECLKLRGLAVPDEDTPQKPEAKKRSGDSPAVARKRTKKSSIQLTKPDDAIDESSTDSHSSTESAPLKTEDVAIKEEPPVVIDDYADRWEGNSNLETDCPTFQPDSVEDTSQYDTFSSSLQDPLSEMENTDNEMPYGTNNPPTALPIASTSYRSIKFVNYPRSKICSYCKRAFRDRFDLRRHVMTHTGEKPYGCNLCSYRSTQKINLELHLATKHMEIRKK